MMRENPPLLPLVGSDLTRFAAAPFPETQKQPRPLCRQDPVGVHLHSTPTFPPPTYYAIDPHNAEGKAWNPLTSCKSFCGRASEPVTDLRSILNRSPSPTASPLAI